MIYFTMEIISEKIVLKHEIIWHNVLFLNVIRVCVLIIHRYNIDIPHFEKYCKFTCFHIKIKL